MTETKKKDKCTLLIKNIDKKIYDEARKVAEESGLTLTHITRMFYIQIANTKSIPLNFNLLLQNQNKD